MTGTPPSSSERDQLAEADWREDQYKVLTRPNGAANKGYAYHEPNEDSEPLCGAGDPGINFVTVSVGEAKRRNKAPCQMCDRILNDW